MARLAVIVPVYGRPELTRAVLEDAARERSLVDTIVVDNSGVHEVMGDERVVTPPSNLGWLGGCNLGLEYAARDARYDAFALLNNDTRLSTGFFEGLLRCLDDTRGGLVGPYYDNGWWPQAVRHNAPAAQWRQRRRHRKVPFLDGTCLVISRPTFESVGLLDSAAFGTSGWGADIDYSLRVRQMGQNVYVTGLSFLNHLRGGTAAEFFGDFSTYEKLGNSELTRGLQAKWGPNWDTIVGMRPPLRVRLNWHVRHTVKRILSRAN